METVKVFGYTESLSLFLLGIRSSIQGNIDFSSPRVFIIIAFSSSRSFTHFLIDFELQKCLDTDFIILCHKKGRALLRLKSSQKTKELI